MVELKLNVQSVTLDGALERMFGKIGDLTPLGSETADALRRTEALSGIDIPQKTRWVKSV